ncbi:hypothetical protein I0C86_11975 [Plantactinospora sp. S1510]|uniref:Uncharacterized protein n=1 Tax=Plantactinospora alkalitolerans TaxID=2789879 RepID=A0ABS0GUD0_9ACTN|nr:hypothetical protein [Plantactinospora alkalitolerans]MBF9129676.1 hypothetical protein [Plantactinospora alkalitolerans]
MASVAAPTAGGLDESRQISAIAETTLVLDCETYTGTVAWGGGVTAVTWARWFHLGL